MRTISVIIIAFLISTFSSLILYFLLPEYRASSFSSIPFTYGPLFESDLNNDGTQEIILMKYDYPGNTFGIRIQQKDGEHINLWTISEPFVVGRLFINDYDHDNIKEIFTITTNGDTLFLYSIKYTMHNFIINRMPIDVAPPSLPQNKKWNISQIVMKFDDVDEDNYNDVILLINTGNVSESSRFYLLNLKMSKIILKSPNLGIQVEDFALKDVNQDGEKEIVPKYIHPSGAISNIIYPMDNQNSWFFVLKKNFTFLFKPLKLLPYPSKLNAYEINIKDSLYYWVYANYQGMDNYPDLLLQINQKGEILKQIKLANQTDGILFKDPLQEKIYFINKNKSILYQIKSRSKLEVVKSAGYLKNCIRIISQSFQNKVFYFVLTPQSIVILNNHFTRIAKFQNPSHLIPYPIYSTVFRHNKKMEFALTVQSHLLQFTLEPRFGFEKILPYFFLIFIGIIITLKTPFLFFSKFLYLFSRTKYTPQKEDMATFLLSPAGKLWHSSSNLKEILHISYKIGQKIEVWLKDYPSILHFILSHLKKDTSRKIIYIQQFDQFIPYIVFVIPIKFLKRYTLGYLIMISKSEEKLIQSLDSSKINIEILSYLTKEVKKFNNSIFYALHSIYTLANSNDFNMEIFRQKFNQFYFNINNQLEKLQYLSDSFDLLDKEYKSIHLSTFILHTIEIFKNNYHHIQVDFEHFHSEMEIVVIPQLLEYLFLQIYEFIVNENQEQMEKICIQSRYIISGENDQESMVLEIYPVLSTEKIPVAEKVEQNKNDKQHLNLIKFMARAQNISLIIQDYPVNPTFKMIFPHN